MIHYTASLLLVFFWQLVLTTSNGTFHECLSKCGRNSMAGRYLFTCKTNSATTCFDKLTRNLSANTSEAINATETFRRLGRNIDPHAVWTKHSLMRNATHYLLKQSVYYPHSNVSPIIEYDVNEARYIRTGNGAEKADPMTERFLVMVTSCQKINATVWPVTTLGIGKPEFFHITPTLFARCRVDNNGDLCDTLSINSAKVVAHDARHICNAHQEDWQAMLDIVDIGDVSKDLGVLIPRCRVIRSISIYSAISTYVCRGCGEDEHVEFRESRSEYLSNLSESGACDQSRFCRSFEYPMKYHFGRSLELISWKSTYNHTFFTNSTTTLENMKITMPKLDYGTVYELFFVLDFGIDKESSFSNTAFRQWMAKDVETTYEYYLRTYADQEECKASKQSNHVNYIVMGTAIPLILVVTGMGMVIYRRSRKKRHSRKKRFNESMELREERYHDMIRCPSDDDIFEIDCERVIIFKDQVLGQGAFGKVYKGKIKGIVRTSFHAASKLTDDQERAENMLVAVKQCYEFADAATKREFLREIEIMKELYQHDSLVNILHCITQYPHKPFSLIAEYCEHGDLLKFLQNSKIYLEELQTDERDNEKIILFDDVAQITFEVADGMAYLAGKGYIHRDLAARNIMVKKGKHVKIGDFGLCRSVVSQDDVYTTKGGRLPIKWMAIESLYDYQFSTKSDVWSYGVLLYEVTTLGLQPYADVVPHDGDFRRAMIVHLRSGARLEKPPSCPDEIYAIMMRTWAEKPEHRASFTEIRETARRLVESLHDLDGGVYGDRYVGVEVNRCDQSDGEEY